MNNKEQVKTVIGTFSLGENKIISIILNNVTIEKEDIIDAIVILKQLADGMPSSKLIDTRNYYSISKAAKKYWEESITFSSSFAIAYILRSEFQKRLANLYLRLFSPKVKIRYFTNNTEADSWLKSNPFGF
jgi:hypothetical protein